MVGAGDVSIEWLLYLQLKAFLIKVIHNSYTNEFQLCHSLLFIFSAVQNYLSPTDLINITLLFWNLQVVVQTKSKSRLRFRIASKFSSQGKSAVSSLGLVEGNSTNTVNTVGDTDESSNEKKGIEIITTAFTSSDDKEVREFTFLIYFWNNAERNGFDFFETHRSESGVDLEIWWHFGASTLSLSHMK